MSKKEEDGSVRKRYEYIKANRHKYNVIMMCRLLEVSPSGYYGWLQKPVSDREKLDQRPGDMWLAMEAALKFHEKFATEMEMEIDQLEDGLSLPLLKNLATIKAETGA